MDKLSGMAMFLRVVECGNFTSAANISGVSSTMVAKQIKDIEQRLGTKLLNRTTRKQSLTDVGALYYERCKKVLDAVELAEGTAMELSTVPRGTVEILSPISFGTQSLIPILCEYMKKYPEVSVSITLDNRIAFLTYDEFELAIRVGTFDEPDIVARPLRSYKRILAASPLYLDTYGIPEHPKQLCDHNCLELAYWRIKNTWDLQHTNGERCEATIKGQFLSNLGSALLIAALNDAGIILQPEPILKDDITNGSLVHVLPDWSYKSTPIYLTYLKNNKQSAKLKSVIEYITDSLS
jgi:DNA-binding transcriptional LysR family regulator